MIPNDLTFLAPTRNPQAYEGWSSKHPTPGGNADDYQNKGVAEKAIRKTMKTKGERKQVCWKQ
jgi:hypothetical protein